MAWGDYQYLKKKKEKRKNNYSFLSAFGIVEIISGPS